MATVPLTPEEDGWIKVADAADEGRGISLVDVDLDDMKEVYDSLNVRGGLAKSRLRKFIRRLQTQQQQQPPPTQQQQQQQQQKQQELALFNLEFDNKPTGSSGVPHIHSDLEEYPIDRLKKLALQTCETPLYRFYHVLDNQKNGKIKYSREVHVQTHLEQVFKDVILCCNYDLKTDLESSLNGLRVDIGVIRNSNDVVCGTAEVKQPKRANVLPPDPEPMNHGKVITQVVSQMIPLRTMYGVKNVYGILSTYSSWQFFKWVPEDEADNVSGKDASAEEAEKRMKNLRIPDTLDAASNEASNQFQTPQKRTKESSRHSSPPLSPSPYIDTDDIDDEEGDESDDSSDHTVNRGLVYASDVIEAGPKALKMLAWVLGEMANSPVENLPAHERDYLYVVQKDAMGGYEKLPHTANFYKGRTPNSRNTKLYLLDELGHRYHGRVYRAMSKNGNLCVLKYFVKSQSCLSGNGKRVELSSELVARKSADYWNLAYSNWLPKAIIWEVGRRGRYYHARLGKDDCENRS